MKTFQNPFCLSGRRILITGASSGIGLATAMLVSRLSGTVVALDFNGDGLDAMHSKLEGDGHVSIQCDLRILEEIPARISEAVSSSGPLDGLVHAAGLPCVTTLRQLTPESYKDVMLVNVDAGIALARAFQSRKIHANAGGSIVFLASVMAHVGSAAAVGYSMSKGAVLSMARSMALELASKNIRVNCVSPGFVRTPMYEKMAHLRSQSQEEELHRAHPLGVGRPEDVANAVAFLLSDASRWITGSALAVDGGYTAL